MGAWSMACVLRQQILYIYIDEGGHSPTPEPSEDSSVVVSPSLSLQPPRLTTRCFVDYDRKKEEAEKGNYSNVLSLSHSCERKPTLSSPLSLSPSLPLSLSLAKTSKIETPEPRKPTPCWSGYNFSESWAPGEGGGGGGTGQMRAPQGLSSLNKVENVCLLEGK